MGAQRLERADRMTPLHTLLVAALDRAQAERPELTLADIAEAAGLDKHTLYRARASCSERTLSRVLAAIRDLTGVRLDVALVQRTDAENKSRERVVADNIRAIGAADLSADEIRRIMAVACNQPRAAQIDRPPKKLLMAVDRWGTPVLPICS